jgi:PBSX family phage portal protein
MGTEKIRRRFRRFIQVVEMTRVFFKEFGDPRTISSKTGKEYRSPDELQAQEPDIQQATEVLHFRIYSPTTPYGVPRWIGNLFNVLGATSADEVNFLYFENKSVPPLALLVSGGRVSQDSVKYLEDFIETEIKGKRNFHKILIIEAESTSGDSPDGLATGKMKIELKPLTNAQNQDGLFQKYDERAYDKIGMSFRLPRLIRGDVRDFNRATAESALEFAETQVFGPERTEFDFQINRIVLGSLGIRYFKFQSNAVLLRDPKVLALIIAELTKAGVLVPADGRALASDMVFNRQLAKIESDWVYQPVMLSQVGIPLDTKIDGKIPGLNAATAPLPPTGPGGGNAAPVVPTAPPASSAAKAGYGGGGGGSAYGYGRGRRNNMKAADASVLQLVRDLLATRDELVKLEENAAAAAHLEASKVEPEASKEEGEVIVIKMTAEEIRTRLRIVPT